MIERKMRWYHYLMLPFWAQLGITVSAGLLILFQALIYDSLEKDIVVFNDVCEVTVGPKNDDGSTYEGARMMCGVTSMQLGHLETPYLFYMLTEGKAPAIVCVKTESEYLKETNWSCEFKEENI